MQPSSMLARTGEIHAPQRLNRFQEAMVRWERLHPYNAGHLLRVNGSLDADRLAQSIRRQCEQCGVGSLDLDQSRGKFSYVPGDPVKPEIRRGNAGGVELETELADEMNQPFIERSHPIRWIVYTDDTKQEWRLLVVYRHLASDAHGVLLLLARVLRDYFDDSVDESRLQVNTLAVPFRLNRSAMDVRFGVVRSFFAMAQSYFSMRRAYRLHEQRGGDDATALVTLESEPGFIRGLVERCKKAHVSVNDAILAAMVTAIAERTPQRREHRRRTKIALASAVNLRSWGRDDLSRCFGTYVGHSVVLVDEPDAGFESVLQQVVVQSNLHKRQRRPAGPAWPLIFAKYLWPMLRIPNNTASYRKLFPLCAGVSSVRVDGTLFGSSAAEIIDYTRICPPGPAMPMVLAPTTFGDRLQLSLVFRRGALTGDEARGLVDRVIQILGDYSGIGAIAVDRSVPSDGILHRSVRQDEPVSVDR